MRRAPRAATRSTPPPGHRRTRAAKHRGVAPNEYPPERRVRVTVPVCCSIGPLGGTRPEIDRLGECTSLPAVRIVPPAVQVTYSHGIQ